LDLLHDNDHHRIHLSELRLNIATIATGIAWRVSFIASIMLAIFVAEINFGNR
jgi:hypothetical protein